MPSFTFEPILTSLQTGILSGKGVQEARKTVGDLAGYWADNASAELISDKVLYVTQTWTTAREDQEGAILIGNTTLMPGTVGGEYFMTRGHWHVKRDRGEIVVTTKGEGLLVLMDDAGDTVTESMHPGSTHNISGTMAHRTVNTGTEPLVFLCVWPADCGHDYNRIQSSGFTRRFFQPPK